MQLEEAKKVKETCGISLVIIQTLVKSTILVLPLVIIRILNVERPTGVETGTIKLEIAEV